MRLFSTRSRGARACGGRRKAVSPGLNWRIGSASSFVLVMALLLSMRPTLHADPVVPANILKPNSPEEAWNVIRLVTANVDRLLSEKRAAEVPVQISYSSPALRALEGWAAGEEAKGRLAGETRHALALMNELINAARADDLAAAKERFVAFREAVDRAARDFDTAVVAAEIFACPMHPEVIARNAATPCGQCGVKLFPRRIPYSFVYAKPGAPTVRLAASLNGPLRAGRSVDVTIRLSRADGSPLQVKDLLVMHTEPIHLLIQEPGLEDYHHEHPVPAGGAGEFRFTFTPKKNSPYRVWADLIPVATGVPEMPFVDLPASGTPTPVIAQENRLTAIAGGYRFALSFAGDGKPRPMAEQTRLMGVSVHDLAGNPVTKLEPFMNAFAHVVGFYEDYQTVVHLHPTGGEILNPNFRGGPALGFQFFPPRNGFLRLYCQVKIDGKMIFAPFNLNVEPWCAPPAK